MKIYKWYTDYLVDMSFRPHKENDFAIVCYHCDDKIDIYKNYICILKDFYIKYEDIKHLTEDKIKKLLMLKD